MLCDTGFNHHKCKAYKQTINLYYDWYKYDMWYEFPAIKAQLHYKLIILRCVCQGKQAEYHKKIKFIN